MNMYIRSVSLCLMVLMCVSSSLRAQEDIARLLKEGAKDGQYLLTGYLNPAMKSLSLGLNQGWYNTAATHKLPGFDLTFTASLMYIPDKDLFYYVDNSKLSAVALTSGGVPTSGNVPTIFGAKTTPVYQTKSPPATATLNFNGPPGIDLKGTLKSKKAYVPVPIANLGIGLPKGTDLKIRFVPTLDLGDQGKFSLFGVGVMHNVKQYIPGLKLVPIDISGFIGYTRMKLDVDLSGNFTGPTPNNQMGNFSMSATTIQGLISKKLSVVTFYAGVGYNIAKSKIAVKGNYDFNTDGDNGTGGDPGEKDPISLDFAASGPRVTTGMRLKLAVFTFHADYTVQKYKSLTAGFGICVR